MEVTRRFPVPRPTSGIRSATRTPQPCIPVAVRGGPPWGRRPMGVEGDQRGGEATNWALIRADNAPETSDIGKRPLTESQGHKTPGLRRPGADRLQERVMGVEPTTSGLGSQHSTTELHPPGETEHRSSRPYFQLIAGMSEGQVSTSNKPVLAAANGSISHDPRPPLAAFPRGFWQASGSPAPFPRLPAATGPATASSAPPPASQNESSGKPAGLQESPWEPAADIRSSRDH